MCETELTPELALELTFQCSLIHRSLTIVTLDHDITNGQHVVIMFPRHREKFSKLNTAVLALNIEIST